MSNDQNIKPIETHYKGYKFRSRLEARWAVFFDALGLKWEYEPEGFELSDGTRYLPDFYIPSLDHYFEVKPSMFRNVDFINIHEYYEKDKDCNNYMVNFNINVDSILKRVDALKMTQFAKDSKIPTVLLDGTPGDRNCYIVRVFDSTRPNPNACMFQNDRDDKDDPYRNGRYKESHPEYMEFALKDNFYFISLEHFRNRFYVLGEEWDAEAIVNYNYENDKFLNKAIIAAREARFEF